MQYCKVQYCTVQCCKVQYCTVQCCKMQYCTVQFCKVQYFTVQYCTVKCYAVQCLSRVTSNHSIGHWSRRPPHLGLTCANTALYYTTLHCTALHCTVLYCTTLTALHYTTLHCTALCTGHCITQPLYWHQSVYSAVQRGVQCSVVSSLQYEV